MTERGTGQSFTACILSGSHSMPLAETTCPRYFTERLNHWHLLAFNFSPAAFNLSITILRFAKVSPKSLPKTMMSSRYTRQRCHCRPLRTVSISLWKVAGALVSPNGMTLNWNRLLRVAKAVIGLSSFFILTYQYPLAKSIVQKYSAPPNVFKVSSIRGRG